MIFLLLNLVVKIDMIITSLINQLSLFITEISISVFGFLGFLARIQREIPPKNVKSFQISQIDMYRKEESIRKIWYRSRRARWWLISLGDSFGAALSEGETQIPANFETRDIHIMCDGLMISDILNLQSHWAQDGFQSLNPNRGLHGTMGTGLLSFNKVVILVSHWIANPHTWCNKSSKVLRHTVFNKLCPLKVKGKPKFWKVPQMNLTWI